MKVRICYTVDVDDRYRRAINLYYGKLGMATRKEIVDWHRAMGDTGDDDILYALDQAEQAVAQAVQQ